MAHPPPWSSPVGLGSSWIAENIDWLPIEPPGVGDPRDGAVGGVGDAWWLGHGGRLDLLIIDCDLVRMTICYEVNTWHDDG